MILRANWWVLLLRGLTAIILAIVTLALPIVTIAVLGTIFGVYALVDGVLAIISTVRAAKGDRPWGAFLLEGIIGLLVGAYALWHPLGAAAALVMVLAIWALITGILEIMAAIRLRRHIRGEWVLILTGVLSIVFALALVAAPLAGAVFLVWALAGYGLMFGILLIVLALRVRRHPFAVAPVSAVI